MHPPIPPSLGVPHRPDLESTLFTQCVCVGHRYAVPSDVAVAHADSNNVGFFAGVRQASDVYRKCEHFRPIPVMSKGNSGKASLEPVTGGVLTRLVTNWQMKLPPGALHRLY